MNYRSQCYKWIYRSQICFRGGLKIVKREGFLSSPLPPSGRARTGRHFPIHQLQSLIKHHKFNDKHRSFSMRMIICFQSFRRRPYISCRSCQWNLPTTTHKHSNTYTHPHTKQFTMQFLILFERNQNNNFILFFFLVFSSFSSKFFTQKQIRNNVDLQRRYIRMIDGHNRTDGSHANEIAVPLILLRSQENIFQPNG